MRNFASLKSFNEEAADFSLSADRIIIISGKRNNRDGRNLKQLLGGESAASLTHNHKIKA
jgi:hypothetical protein